MTCNACFCVMWVDSPDTDLVYVASTLPLAKEYVKYNLPLVGSAEGFRIYATAIDSIYQELVYEEFNP